MGQSAQVSLVENGPARAMLRIDRVLRLPTSLAPDRQQRAEETVDVPITTYVWITADSARVDFETTVDNRAKDHRLRAVFHTDICVDTCHVQGHFDVVERQLALPSGEGWLQKPQATKCTKGFVDISDGKKGLGVVVFGLPEYEVKPTLGGTAVAITLLRCVGWLSRDDYPTRPCNAGPKIPTPDAQCQGQWTFRYGVVPHKGTWLDADLWHHAEALRAPLRAWQTPLVAEGQEGIGEQSFLSVEPHTMVVTALKKAERSEALVVRLLNITDAQARAKLTFCRRVAKAYLANLNEEPLEELESDGPCITVAARGKQLVTLLIELE
jgi:alpha-mannosidase